MKASVCSLLYAVLCGLSAVAAYCVWGSSNPPLVVAIHLSWLGGSAVAFATCTMICLSLSDLGRTPKPTKKNTGEAPDWMK